MVGQDLFFVLRHDDRHRCKLGRRIDQSAGMFRIVVLDKYESQSGIWRQVLQDFLKPV
jgi:hypothetical protein